MNVTSEQEAILEENGWTVTCHSPLEISHIEGSRACGLAAAYALPEILKDIAEQDMPIDRVKLERPSSADVLAELLSLIKRMRAIADVALNSPEDQKHGAWKIAYGLVFSDAGSTRIRELRKLLDVDMDYDDPNSDYDDDVLAYVHALEGLSTSLEPFVAALTD